MESTLHIFNIRHSDLKKRIMTLVLDNIKHTITFIQFVKILRPIFNCKFSELYVKHHPKIIINIKVTKIKG